MCTLGGCDIDRGRLGVEPVLFLRRRIGERLPGSAEELDIVLGCEESAQGIAFRRGFRVTESFVCNVPGAVED